MESGGGYAKDSFRISHNELYILADKPFKITFYIALGALMCGSLINFVAKCTTLTISS